MPHVTPWTTPLGAAKSARRPSGCERSPSSAMQPGLLPSCYRMMRVVCGRSPMYPLHSIAIHRCSGQRPIAGAHGYPAGQRKNQEAGKDGNCPASARPVRFRRCPPRVPRLTADLFPRFARSYLRSAVRRASRSREAPPQSRLGALLPLSLVGTRSCFSRDQFSQRWGASFSLRRLGAAHRFLRPSGACANFRSNTRSSCCIRSGCWSNLRSATWRGLRARARILAMCGYKFLIGRSIIRSKRFSINQSNQSFPRTKEQITSCHSLN